MGKQVVKWTVVGSMLTATVEGVDKPLTVDCMAVDAGYDGLSDLGKIVFMNGVKQKVGDSMAGVKSPRDRMDAMEGTAGMLLVGKWGKVKKAAQRATDLANALMVVKGWDLETAMEKVVAVEKDIWGQWEKHPAVAFELVAIESKRASERLVVAKRAAKDAPDLDI